MKIAAVDYGEKRVGIAVSDELGMFAHPLATVESASEKERIKKTLEHLRQAAPELVLVGLPKNMDGSEGPSAIAARSFAAEIEKGFTARVKMVDERLSTVQASRMMREAGKNAKRQKGSIDVSSATVILQAHLDAATL